MTEAHCLAFDSKLLRREQSSALHFAIFNTFTSKTCFCFFIHHIIHVLLYYIDLLYLLLICVQSYILYIHWIYNMIVHGGKDALQDRGTTNKALRFSSARRILEEFGAVQRLCAKYAGAGTIQSVSRF